MLNILIEIDTGFFKELKPYARCSNQEWLACMSMGYV